VPAYVAVEAYVESSFGVWSIAGGLSALTDALVTRLGERGVELRLDCEVTEIEVSAGRVTAVHTAGGDRLPADVVVSDVDPRVTFGQLLCRRAARATRSACRAFLAATAPDPLAVTHVGLRGNVPHLPEEVVYHGDPLLVLSTAAGSAPPGAAVWTLWTRGGEHLGPPGRLGALNRPVQSGRPDPLDALDALAGYGIDVRPLVAQRIDRSRADLVAETGGSSYGLAGAGWRAHAARARFGNPLPGLHLLGAGMHPGPSIPYVVLGAASVAARIGKA
jgi:UDP-galactopyranose mutase